MSHVQGQRRCAIRPPGIQGTLRLDLRLLNTGPVRDRFLLTLPLAHGLGAQGLQAPAAWLLFLGEEARRPRCGPGFCQTSEALAGWHTLGAVVKPGPFSSLEEPDADRAHLGNQLSRARPEGRKRQEGGAHPSLE